MAGNGSRNVGIEVRIIGMDEPTFNDRVVEPLAGRDHPRVVLGEGRDSNAALSQLLADLAGPPGIEGALDDRVLLGQLVHHVGDIEHCPIAGEDFRADVEALVDPDDRRVGPFPADVDADDDPLPVLEVGGEVLESARAGQSCQEGPRLLPCPLLAGLPCGLQPGARRL
jgi:hypothetical protein